MSVDPVERRVATLAASVTELREQFAVFGNLAKVLAGAETRIAAAEQDRRDAVRESREAQRREAEAMAAMAEMEEEVEQLRADPESAMRQLYRRGYETGYSAGKRGAARNANPAPRGDLRAVGGSRP